MRTNATQILKENYQEYVNACLENPVDFAAWVELESESDPDFFRFLFDNENLNDFECPDRAAFEKFLENLKINTTADTEIRKTMEDMEVLTVAKARTLMGKTIEWTYIGYNPQQYYRTTVGDIVTGEELARKEPMEGYESRWDYWEKEFPRALDDERNTLYLLDERGKKTYMVAYCNKYNFYPEPTFTCSDADREVYFRTV